ncbi:MAG: LysR substrate-binding domain-containing protein [Nitratireductor sp.]
MSVSPPRPKAPPLNALRAFEASARLGGFANAAQELNVTPGAIAQHVKTLEIWAGRPLFERHAQGVRLTHLGEQVRGDFTRAFDATAAAAQHLRVAANPGRIRIATLPSVAQLWLSPRLPQIRAAVSGLSVSVTALEQPPNLLRDDFDAALFFEETPVAAGGVAMFEDEIMPVCTPQIAARLKVVGDLAGETLLHDSTWNSDWAHWMAATAPGIAAGFMGDATGPVFSLYALAVEEAVNGAGILMGHKALVQSRLDDGRLVAPFSVAANLPRRLVLRMADNAQRKPLADFVRQLRHLN